MCWPKRLPEPARHCQRQSPRGLRRELVLQWTHQPGTSGWIKTRRRCVGRVVRYAEMGLDNPDQLESPYSSAGRSVMQDSVIHATGIRCDDATVYMIQYNRTYTYMYGVCLASRPLGWTKPCDAM